MYGWVGGHWAVGTKVVRAACHHNCTCASCALLWCHNSPAPPPLNAHNGSSSNSSISFLAHLPSMHILAQHIKTRLVAQQRQQQQVSILRIHDRE